MVCDLLLDDSVRWLWPGAKAPPYDPEPGAGYAAVLDRYADQLAELDGPAADVIDPDVKGCGAATPCYTPGHFARAAVCLAGSVFRPPDYSIKRSVARFHGTGRDAAQASLAGNPDRRVRGRLLRARRGDPRRGRASTRSWSMEVFARQAGVLCGIDEAKVLLAHVLGDAPSAGGRGRGACRRRRLLPKEVVLRIRARYRAFGLYETAILGMMAQSTGWATAARECVEAAAPEPVISFGARHVHPDITDTLDYAAIVGGCVGRLHAGRRAPGRPRPTGTMPHSLVLIFGDTVTRQRRSTGTWPRTCRASCWSTRSATRRRRRCASRRPSVTGSTASASTRRPSAAASPPTWCSRSGRGSTRPASSMSGSSSAAA